MNYDAFGNFVLGSEMSRGSDTMEGTDDCMQWTGAPINVHIVICFSTKTHDAFLDHLNPLVPVPPPLSKSGLLAISSLKQIKKINDRIFVIDLERRSESLAMSCFNHFAKHIGNLKSRVISKHIIIDQEFQSMSLMNTARMQGRQWMHVIGCEMITLPIEVSSPLALIKTLSYVVDLFIGAVSCTLVYNCVPIYSEYFSPAIARYEAIIGNMFVILDILTYDQNKYLDILADLKLSKGFPIPIRGTLVDCAVKSKREFLCKTPLSIYPDPMIGVGYGPYGMTQPLSGQQQQQRQQQILQQQGANTRPAGTTNRPVATPQVGHALYRLNHLTVYGSPEGVFSLGISMASPEPVCLYITQSSGTSAAPHIIGTPLMIFLDPDEIRTDLIHFGPSTEDVSAVPRQVVYMDAGTLKGAEQIILSIIVRIECYIIVVTDLDYNVICTLAVEQPPEKGSPRHSITDKSAISLWCVGSMEDNVNSTCTHLLARYLYSPDLRCNSTSVCRQNLANHSAPGAQLILNAWPRVYWEVTNVGIKRFDGHSTLYPINQSDAPTGSMATTRVRPQILSALNMSDQAPLKTFHEQYRAAVEEAQTTQFQDNQLVNMPAQVMSVLSETPDNESFEKWALVADTIDFLPRPTKMSALPTCIGLAVSTREASQFLFIGTTGSKRVDAHTSERPMSAGVCFQGIVIGNQSVNPPIYTIDCVATVVPAFKSFVFARIVTPYYSNATMMFLLGPHDMDVIILPNGHSTFTEPIGEAVTFCDFHRGLKTNLGVTTLAFGCYIEPNVVNSEKTFGVAPQWYHHCTPSCFSVVVEGKSEMCLYCRSLSKQITGVAGRPGTHGCLKGVAPGAQRFHAK